MYSSHARRGPDGIEVERELRVLICLSKLAIRPIRKGCSKRLVFKSGLVREEKERIMSKVLSTSLAVLLFAGAGHRRPDGIVMS